MKIIIQTIKNHYAFLIVATLTCLLVVVGISDGIFNPTSAQKRYTNLFLGLSFMGPFLVSSLAKNKKVGLIHGIFSLLFILLAIAIFWNQNDYLWFSGPDPMGCAGPCYGTFSYGNEAPYFKAVLFGIVGSIVGAALNTIIRRNKTISEL